MNDLEKLARDAKKLERDIKRAANEMAKDGAVGTAGALSAATPIDTGKAASNWLVSLGFPKTREIEAHEPGEGGSTKAANVAATVKAAREAVKNKKLGQNIFITNNIDYMDPLANDGHSPQQPNPGWIEAVGNITERNWKNKFPTHLG